MRLGGGGSARHGQFLGSLRELSIYLQYVYKSSMDSLCCRVMPRLQALLKNTHPPFAWPRAVCQAEP